jgi:TolB-like protein
VASETEAGRGHELKERSIAVGALGFSSSFDPRFDPSVRVVAARVRKALDRHYGTEGADDPVRIEIPRGGYQVRFVAQPPTPPGSQAGDASPAIAVVTFVDLDPESECSHLSVGLAEALVATLSAFPGCRVIGPVAHHAGSDGVEKAQELRRTRGATHVLQGSVRCSDGIVRVSARLTDAASGEVRWSQQFDERADGLALLAVEDRIVRRVSGVVADFRGVIHQRRPDGPAGRADPTAYDAMLQYYAYLGDLDAAKVEPTTEALERALERSPDDPLLMAMLAGMVLFHAVGQLGGITDAVVSADMVERAVALARRSNAIDPTNPHALTVLAIVELLHGHPDRCRAELDRVVEMRPTNPSLLFMAGVGTAMGGDWDAGIRRIRESMELNALHPGWHHGFLALDALVRDEPALALAEAQLVDTPGLVWGPLLRAAALAALDRLDDAAHELSQLPSGLPGADDGRRDLFEGHMRLSDEVIGVLVGALAKIPPPAQPPP